jgi:hypothetical protein
MPILASLGTANDRAFGIGDSSMYEYNVIPPAILNNAEIIYDASNIESYPETGTTWYDISGNDRHATWSAQPTLSGAGANKYVSAGGGISFVIPEVFSPVVDFSYYILCENPFQLRWHTYSDRQLVSTSWYSSTFVSNGRPTIQWRSQGTGGFGSGSIVTPLIDVNGYVFLRFNISGNGTSFSSSVQVAGQTGSVNETNTSTQPQNFTSAVTVGNVNLEPLNIKMILLYSTANDPGLTAVYNAFKGRFNL